EKRPKQRALLFRKGRAIWTKEVDRCVAWLAEQLVLVRVAEDLESSRVEESDPSTRVDDVERIAHRPDRPKHPIGRPSKLHSPPLRAWAVSRSIGLLAILRGDR